MHVQSVSNTPKPALLLSASVKNCASWGHGDFYLHWVLLCGSRRIHHQPTMASPDGMQLAWRGEHEKTCDRRGTCNCSVYWSFDDSRREHNCLLESRSRRHFQSELRA